MLDPANDLLPPTSSPTISSVSSSDLDTESTGSFFHDRSTTLGTLMGVTFPAITFRAPSQHHRDFDSPTATAVVASPPRRRNKRASSSVFAPAAAARRRRWWRLCGDSDAKPASLGEFLEVERRFGDSAFYGAAAELESVVGGEQRLQQPSNGRALFADGRVLPPQQPSDDGDETSSTAGVLCRFPVSITGICR